jgi:hypothetical protein
MKSLKDMFESPELMGRKSHKIKNQNGDSSDEAAFIDKQISDKKIADRNGNGDDVFSATNVSQATPLKGKNPDSPDGVYEDSVDNSKSKEKKPEEDKDKLKERRMKFLYGEALTLAHRPDHAKKLDILNNTSPGKSQGYSKDAVDKAIASSNRSGKKIGGREAKMIHAVLKGWRNESQELIEEIIDSLDEVSKDVLGQYIKLAHAQSHIDAGRGNNLIAAGQKEKNDKKFKDKAFDMGAELLGKAAKRQAGINKAVNKIVKEDEDTVSEEFLDFLYESDLDETAGAAQQTADNHWKISHDHTQKEREAYKKSKELASSDPTAAKIWMKIQDSHLSLAKQHDDIARHYYNDNKKDKK